LALPTCQSQSYWDDYAEDITHNKAQASLSIHPVIVTIGVVLLPDKSSTRDVGDCADWCSEVA
jgi:hypothetical protein